MTTWWHGTSDEAGLEEGDYLDPKAGSFEPCVWCTSSEQAAWTYARSRAALGGKPVVFRVELVAGAVVVACPAGAKPDYSVDADAILDEDGELGVPCLAVLRRGVARVVGPS
jgi:hypothetical protein